MAQVNRQNLNTRVVLPVAESAHCANYCRYWLEYPLGIKDEEAT